jgi:hypothetical protein
VGKFLIDAPRRRVALRALLLLLALFAGWAAHGWHHVADPACDVANGPGAHACTVCSALHGPALGAAPVVTAAPVRAVVRAPYLATAGRATAGAVCRPGAPRAPPAA